MCASIYHETSDTTEKSLKKLNTVHGFLLRYVFFTWFSMATLRDIRTRIASVKNIAKITSAMKMVAVAKMRRAQNNITAARPYADKLSQMLSLLAANADENASPLFERRKEVKNIALIVVTADRGLCGGFNSNIIRTTQNQIKALEKEYAGATVHLVTVGRRAVDFFGRREIPVADKFPGIFQKLEFPTAQAIMRVGTEGFLGGKFDKVLIIANEFRSIAKQVVVVRDLLPIMPPAEGTSTDASGAATKAKNKVSVEYIYEPSQREILATLLPRHLNTQIWRVLLDSNAAEQAARMMAMENATNNAKDLNRTLTLKYNNLRQAAITKEILEVVGGAEALNKG
jgi:F-type H+-transporting ATPase subunit gamma